MKKLHQFFDQGTPEYVILHAKYRASRGKRPSMSFSGINNPREGLKTAEIAICRNDVYVMSVRNRSATFDVLSRISDALGFRPATQEDVKKFLEKSQKRDNEGIVPFVGWDRHSRDLSLSWNYPRESWGSRSAFAFIS